MLRWIISNSSKRYSIELLQPSGKMMVG